MTGRRHELLDDEPVPKGAEHVYDWFLELAGARQRTPYPAPIGYRDIESYARLHGLLLERWEVDAIRRLDALWMRLDSEARNKE